MQKYKIGDILSYKFDTISIINFIEITEYNEKHQTYSYYLYNPDFEIAFEFYGLNEIHIKKAYEFICNLYENVNEFNTIRPIGDITTDLEPLLFELHLTHDMQHGEVLALINGWQKIHVPNCIETYMDNSSPKLIQTMYGPIKI